MKKIKYPALDEKIIKPNQMLFRFDCGDMWKRKKLNRCDDIQDCLAIIIPELKKRQKNSKAKKLNKFSWFMEYFIPDENNIKSLKNNGKYEVQQHNHHRLEPLRLVENGTVLEVFEDLVFLDYEIIELVANQSNELKEIYFTMGLLDLGFLDNYDYQQEYIEKKLKIKDWWHSLIELKEPTTGIVDEPYNDLDVLINLKDVINPKIKFRFNYKDKDDKKILKKHSII